MVVAASSGIGAALARRWLARGWKVAGTYRRRAPLVDALSAEGASLVACDLTDPAHVARASAALRELVSPWDVLVLAAGRLEPIGPFDELDMDAWERSLQANLVGPLRLVRALLDARRRDAARPPSVLFFAGGGTNGPVPRFSAYTLSKVALIKMTELLAAELPDVRFTIVGPGWVDTPIHGEVLAAGSRAGEVHARTQERLAAGDFTPMEDVVACCEWLLDAPVAEVSGRNFSVVHDRWGTDELRAALQADPDLYKLRRHGNARVLVRSGA